MYTHTEYIGTYLPCKLYVPKVPSTVASRVHTFAIPSFRTVSPAAYLQTPSSPFSIPGILHPRLHPPLASSEQSRLTRTDGGVSCSCCLACSLHVLSGRSATNHQLRSMYGVLDMLLFVGFALAEHSAGLGCFWPNTPTEHLSNARM